MTQPRPSINTNTNKKKLFIYQFSDGTFYKLCVCFSSVLSVRSFSLRIAGKEKIKFHCKFIPDELDIELIDYVIYSAISVILCVAANQFVIYCDWFERKTYYKNTISRH